MGVMSVGLSSLGAESLMWSTGVFGYDDCIYASGSEYLEWGSGEAGCEAG